MNEEFKKEEQYLNETLQAIDSRIEGINNAMESQKEFAQELKKDYMHDASMFDSELSNEVAMKYKRLNDFMDFVDDQYALAKRLKEIREKPYFGRIDFLIDGDDEEMKLYIGLMSIDYNHQLKVVDWRAPVSELFYEAGKGRGSYEAPNGTISGEIKLKRQYDIENSKLLEFYDVDINLFDAYLQKVLSKAKGDSLQNIASTIQKEQNQIIRNLKDDVLVVQGFAGCGKTTIALHHVAYALYRLKDLKSVNILFFSPNEAFLSYIQKVLPDLGEDNTRSATFPKFIKRMLKTIQPVESSDEFVLRYVFASPKIQQEIDEKLNFSTRQKMKDWLDKKAEKLEFVSDFCFEDIMIDTQTLNGFLKNDFLHAKYREKIFYITNKIFEQMKTEDLAKKEAVLETLYDCLNAPMHLQDIYAEFLKDFGYSAMDIDDKLFFDDAVLLCVMKELTQNILIRMNIKHIVLDEIQDYPLLFIDFLMRIFKHATFSIFGDIHQKTVPGQLNSLEDICKLETAKDKSHFVELTKTYRSSEEIVEYSSKLVGNPRHNAFRLKNGNPVTELWFEEKEFLKQILNILKKASPSASVGIITGDTETAKEVFDFLCQNFDESILSFIKNAYSVAGTQVQVAPISLAKGLEFDTVIVVEKGKLFEIPQKNKFLFVSCTRAINQLFVLKNKNAKN